MPSIACCKRTVRSRSSVRVRQHELEKQRLAQSRRHLGDENRVAGVDKRLVGMRQHGVHRVAHLVRQREHRIQRVVVVEQHVGLGAIHRRRIRPAPLAGVLVHVDRLAEQHLAHRPLIVDAQRRDRLGQPFQDVVVGILPVEVDEGNRRVVRMVAVEAERALAQAVIAAQRLGSRFGFGDQILDHGGRNVVAVQRRVERRAVAAGLRIEPVALQHAVVQRRIGIDRRLKGAVKRPERRRAIGLIAVGRQNGAILPVAEGDLARRSRARSRDA